ncbi:hypothetical protein BOTCAL_0301g00170 [Botryotinia calthae]|uniref:Uncharacterized protein n=1 Tax=Botryotinia calthae TaxID=38488 RepID=A0A4Y8CV78_9HELO|nr:hypothetical protein BOTCAL_0301g00170 [Botryotinia calthae]
MSTSYTKTQYTCGHMIEKETPTRQASEDPSQEPKKSLTRTLTGKVKKGLKRALSLKSDKPTMRYTNVKCPACAREVTATFTSDRYAGWVDELPSPSRDSFQHDRPNLQERNSDEILRQEIISQEQLAPLETVDDWRREAIHGETRRREAAKQVQDRDDALNNLEGRRTGIQKRPTMPFGGYWDPKEESSRTQYQKLDPHGYISSDSEMEAF